MRRLLFIIIPCLILFGCKNESSNDSSTASDSIKPQKEEKETYLFSKDTNTNLERWTEYYESIDADFELKKFEIISTSALEKMKGTIPGNFDEDFDPIYESLLIYSPSGEKYIDLDSYHWEIGEENQDRKSTRLNSSHVAISYAVFCLKKKTNTHVAHEDT